MKKVRVDKWLWAVRIFKTRTLATKQCKAGRIKIGENPLKASYLISGGETLIVRKNGFNFQFLVKELLDKRVSAVLAAPCYENVTTEEELKKYESWFYGKAAPEQRIRGTGRPSKKERREIDEFKEFFFDETDFEE